jgi:uncharacterized SAM-binding protein YcdF (DUF218 family)
MPSVNKLAKIIWDYHHLRSGNEGVGREVSGFKGTPEAERFTQVALDMGVPKQSILIENKARNTGENILLSHKLLQNKHIEASSIIAVQKPYMERRTFATLKAQWPKPQPEFIVTSQDISFEDYITNPLYSAEYTINVMVGDLQRIKEYPKRGFQIEQAIPPEVWSAWEQLVMAGYDKRLIK